MSRNSILGRAYLLEDASFIGCTLISHSCFRE